MKTQRLQAAPIISLRARKKEKEKEKEKEARTHLLRRTSTDSVHERIKRFRNHGGDLFVLFVVFLLFVLLVDPVEKSGDSGNRPSLQFDKHEIQKESRRTSTSHT